ncbi:MAG: FAD:protein FMN transferase [Firmicutes bacterium]|nr:FAD:protein FMN transferase [Bacillota bacterium]
MRGLSKSRNHFLVIVGIFIGVAVLCVVAYYGVYVPYVESHTTTNQRSRILMDTTVDIRVDARNSEELVNQAFAEIEGIEKSLSRYVDTSEVSKINAHAGQWVEVSQFTIDLVKEALRISELSDGAFDVTIGAVIELWGFGTGDYKVPSEEEIVQALKTVGYEKVEIDEAERKVRIPEGTILDLGGIAKGYAVDQASRLLRKSNAKRSIINAGGDISVIGRRPDDTPWRVGVQNPDNPADIRWILPLEDSSVVTSGDYQRYFVFNDQKWHHIIDPRTGYPARELKSVTVVTESATVADALSTAIFVLGMEAGSRLVEEMAGVEAIIVSQDGVWISPELEEQIL